MYRKLFILTLLLTIGFSGVNHYLKAENHSQTHNNHTSAPLFQQLGNHHHPISSTSKLAQRYFDQGLTLAYGFNHAEAARSFTEAAKLDPKCAICYWGIAFVSGPNINAPMEDAAVSNAWQAIQKAKELSPYASEKEKAYINALSLRYTPEPVEDRKPLDLAFAKAMQQVSQRYPDDLDAATIYAESLMDTTPWDYWQENGEPKPEAVEIINTLESVIKRDPNHPGANHLYIHAVEAEKPELAEKSADRLLKFAPDSGHLVHMASHIYIRLGRYNDAVIANQKAILADKNYLAGCHLSGMYPLAYMPHNQHFLWFAALMNGQSQIALDAAKETAKVNPELMRDPSLAGSLQHYSIIPLYTYVRFGLWDKILSTEAPASDLKYPTGVWHYARGMAFADQGKLIEAQEALTNLKTIAADPTLKELKIWGFNSTAKVLNIATEVLSAKIAVKQDDYNSAIAHLKQGVAIEDSLIYTEPEDWYHPVRQLLGLTLLEANQPIEAEQVFREELKIYPENGWSLDGLSQSLASQGKIKEARAIESRLEKAWQNADVTITATRF
jgi:tetratricopeptide (TPR) repeat protein